VKIPFQDHFANPVEQKKQVPLESTANLTLVIRAEPLKYSFGFSNDPARSNIQWISSIETKALVWMPSGYVLSQIIFLVANFFSGQGFTGIHFAMYATGNGKPWPHNSGPVGFNWVEENYFEEKIPSYDQWE